MNWHLKDTFVHSQEQPDKCKDLCRFNADAWNPAASWLHGFVMGDRSLQLQGDSLLLGRNTEQTLPCG